MEKYNSIILCAICLFTATVSAEEHKKCTECPRLTTQDLVCNNHTKLCSIFVKGCGWQASIASLNKKSLTNGKPTINGNPTTEHIDDSGSCYFRINFHDQPLQFKQKNI